MGRQPKKGSQKWIEKYGINAVSEDKKIDSKAVNTKQVSSIKMVATSDDYLVDKKRKHTAEEKEEETTVIIKIYS